jgi:hypothetical protein
MMISTDYLLMSSQKPIFLNPDKGILDRWLCGSALCLIWLYQHTLSRLTGNCCRFYPSCSNYGAQAYWSRSFLSATILTVWRIMRCNPFCKGGYDPLDSDEAATPDGQDAERQPDGR